MSLNLSISKESVAFKYIDPETTNFFLKDFFQDQKISKDSKVFKIGF